MTEFDYRSAIESAKIDPGYLEKFAGFHMNRCPDSISIIPAGSNGQTIHYPIEVDTEALNRELNRIRDSAMNLGLNRLLRNQLELD